MKSRGNRLGFLALILGAFALFVAFSGRHAGPGFHHERMAERGIARAEAQAERARERAERAVERAEARAERAVERAEARAERWPEHHEWRHEQRHHGPFFFGPLFFFGNVVRVLVGLLLIGFGIRLLRRGGWRGPGSGPSDGPGSPVGPIFHA